MCYKTDSLKQHDTKSNSQAQKHKYMYDVVYLLQK